MKYKTIGSVNRTLSLLLAILFAFLCSTPGRAAIATQANPTGGNPPTQDLIAPCIAAGFIIGVGAGGIYIIIKLCQKVPPTTPPPPPPPPPPPAPPSTNSSLTFVNFALSSLTFPPLPTNNPPSTNIAFASPPRYWYPESWSSSQIATTNIIEDLSYQDLTSLNYMDTNGPSSAPCYAFASGSISNLQSSTDLVAWQPYKFDAWFSTNGMTTVLYDGQGIPVITNYAPGTIQGATNQIAFGIWVNTNEPRKFVRYWLNQ